jgi:membrane-associated phospholipid phosphatase
VQIDHPPRQPTGWFRATCPLRKSDFALLFGFYAAMTAVWSVIGLVISKWADDTSLGHDDEQINQWFADHRTSGWNTASHVGSLLSETAIKIALTAVVVIVLFRMFHRWLEPLVVAVSLIVEAMVFISVTYIVGRPRPDVPRLDGSPVDSSFPSGHTAAAVCYVAIALVVCWHTRRTWLKALALAISVVVPVIVGVSRVYRGMHHLSDVVAGAIIGALSVYAVIRIMVHAEQRRLAETDQRDPSRRVDPVAERLVPTAMGVDS